MTTTFQEPVVSANTMANDSTMVNDVPIAARPAPMPPEKQATVDKDTVSTRLFGAAKEVTDEIDECEKIIAKANIECKAKQEQAENERVCTVKKAEDRREDLKSQFQNALNEMQHSFGIVPKKHVQKKPKQEKSYSRHSKSIKVLIAEYLEKNRSARTSEIRSFLQSQGRMTNPGVELSRMVKDGTIVNKERGMYTLGKVK